MTALIRQLTGDDRDIALAVINSAAEWYREFLPPEHHRDQEMMPGQWDGEAARLTWYGAFFEGRLVGVMGLEPVRDAVLFRHAYVLPAYQHRGIGTLLLRHLESRARDVRIIVGTYADNIKARRLLEKEGYRLATDSQAVLRAYYVIPEDRLATSVVYEKTLRSRLSPRSGNR